MENDDENTKAGSDCQERLVHPLLERFWKEKGPRFTELIHVGGSNPSGYGIIDGGRGIYGRQGLNQQEFFEAITMQSYVDGMLAVLGDDADLWLSERIKEESEQQESRMNA